MGKLVDKVKLRMNFREVSEIIGNPHNVVFLKHTDDLIYWQYFNSTGLLEIGFHYEKVSSIDIYKKGDLFPDHSANSVYGQSENKEVLRGGFILKPGSIDKLKKEFGIIDK